MQKYYFVEICQIVPIWLLHLNLVSLTNTFFRKEARNIVKLNLYVFFKLVDIILYFLLVAHPISNLEFIVVWAFPLLEILKSNNTDTNYLRSCDVRQQ